MSVAPSPSPEFLAAFRARADGGERMDFARFMELALYHPGLGYYQRARSRIGLEAGTDFFTASSSGPVFGELVASACHALIGPEGSARSTFVEIGSETSESILAGVRHPFAAVRTCRLGEALALGGPCVVFSNELFDAQPFRRFVFRAGQWRELGVGLLRDTLVEIELSTPAPEFLPSAAPEGYQIDAPLAAAELARQIAVQPWTGLFVAVDYGKSWRELIEACPAGTARAYHRHQQHNALLARPGEQDLTCHVCWDWISEVLTQNGFRAPRLESQEAFLIRHASQAIATISTSEAAHYSRKKLSLLQLLHPAHLGQKFQVLHAIRA